METELSYGEGKRMELILEMYLKKINNSIDEVKERILKIENKLSKTHSGNTQFDVQSNEKTSFEQGKETDNTNDLISQEGKSHSVQQTENRNVFNSENVLKKKNQQQKVQQTVFNKNPVPTEKINNERVGNLKPGDISIEKFFYAGKS